MKDILRRVRNIEIKTRELVEGLISGEYHSIFKGRGIEFAEVREYQPGDDIRTIDWNVTARFNAPFVKEYIEERDLTLYIAFDVSASNEFGYRRSKKEVGYEIAASIMFSALRNNDNVGLCLFSEGVEKFIPPRKGRKHLLRLLRELVYWKTRRRATDIHAALAFLNKVLKRRSIIFIISDFLSPSPPPYDFEEPLKQLRSRHDVVPVVIMDVREVDIPDIGYIFLEDLETGEQLLLNTSDPLFRQQYRELVAQRHDELRQMMKRLKLEMIEVRTDEPFYIPMQRFFALRKRRAGI